MVIVLCGYCSVWLLFCVVIVLCGYCSVWLLFCVVIVLCGYCWVINYCYFIKFEA